MRGGSRSGMACAFVRFSTQEQAVAAIEAIHGQHKLPDASEPLVVRWADAPGSRRREGRDGARRRGGGGGGARRGRSLEIAARARTARVLEQTADRSRTGRCALWMPLHMRSERTFGRRAHVGRLIC